MLGFGLRATWFSLSLSGLIACWVTMFLFGRALRTYWAPTLYCFGCTLMQGIFCLGLIYRMDPFQMPKAFCTAQSIIIGFASFLMSGVAAAFTMATCEAANKPKTWTGGGEAALTWKSKYLLPLVAYPLIASVIQISVTFSLDSGLPSDDLHCDYAEPEWLRFLSYAGFPLLLAIPCVYYSITSVIKISKTNEHLRRSRDPAEIVDDSFTAEPERPRRIQMRLGRMLSSSTASFSTHPRRQPLKHTHSRSQIQPYPSTSTRELPSLSLDTTGDLNEDPDKEAQDIERVPDSPASSSFPTFANPPNMGTVTFDPDGDAFRQSRRSISRRSTEYDDAGLHRQPSENWVEVMGPLDSMPDISGEMTDPESDTPTKRGDDLEWSNTSFQREDSDSIYKGKESMELERFEEDGRPRRKASKVVHRPLGLFRKRRPLPSLDAAIGRIILFQFSFGVVQILCTMSTLIDVIKHRDPPTAFGTQHVALLLSAWGPVLIFGILPLFCRNYSFWLPRT